MKTVRSSLPAFVAGILAAAVSTVPVASADVITDWNKITVDATKVPPALNTNLATRVAAIEAIAVYDAVNSIRQVGKPYHYYAPPNTAASPEAAAAQAAHDVLVNYFPAQQAALDLKLADSLAAITDGPEKNAGRAIGSAAATAIIALRVDDGSTPNITYAGPANPGVGEWRPTPGASPGTFPPGINQQWGAVKPFVLRGANRFDAPKPPAVGSPKYKKALAEVKELGSATSSTRTEDQTHIAQFWKQDAELPINEATRLLSESHGLNIEENALLFALVDIALADVRIAVWSAKYKYTFWRPITALNADRDGAVRNNYAAWTPLLVTPSHPSYPSGHSATVNAGITVLQHFFGDWNPLNLQTTTPGEPPRSVRRLSDIEKENGLSRIYGGIHFSFDNESGQKLGEHVGYYVVARGPRLLAIEDED